MLINHNFPLFLSAAAPHSQGAPTTGSCDGASLDQNALQPWCSTSKPMCKILSQYICDYMWISYIMGNLERSPTLINFIADWAAAHEVEH